MAEMLYGLIFIFLFLVHSPQGRAQEKVRFRLWISCFMEMCEERKMHLCDFENNFICTLPPAVTAAAPPPLVVAAAQHMCKIKNMTESHFFQSSITLYLYQIFYFWFHEKFPNIFLINMIPIINNVILWPLITVITQSHCFLRMPLLEFVFK